MFFIQEKPISQLSFIILFFDTSLLSHFSPRFRLYLSPVLFKLSIYHILFSTALDVGAL